jgi:hypothetical protein
MPGVGRLLKHVEEMLAETGVQDLGVFLEPQTGLLLACQPRPPTLHTN